MRRRLSSPSLAILTPDELAEVRASRRPRGAREVCEELRARAERCKSGVEMAILYREADKLEAEARAAGLWEE